MKGITKHLLLVFSLMLILFRPIQAYAEINEQDNLKVKLQVEKIENIISAALDNNGIDCTYDVEEVEE